MIGMYALQTTMISSMSAWRLVLACNPDALSNKVEVTYQLKYAFGVTLVLAQNLVFQQTE